MGLEPTLIALNFEIDPPPPPPSPGTLKKYLYLQFFKVLILQAWAQYLYLQLGKVLVRGSMYLTQGSLNQ